MNAKELQMATVLIDQIHELDREITSMEKLANGVLQDSEFKDMRISFEKPKPQKFTDEQLFGVDPESMFPMFQILESPFSGSPFGRQPRTKKPEPERVNNDFKIDGTELLYVAQALINVKKEKCRAIVNQIISMGVTL